MDAQTQHEIEKLRGEVRELNNALRARIAAMLSRKGGYVEGQLHLGGWLQLTANDSGAGAPASGRVRLEAVMSGGKETARLVFPSGKTVVLGQED